MVYYNYPDATAVAGYDSESDEEDQRFQQRRAVGSGFKDFTRGIKKGFSNVGKAVKKISEPVINKFKKDAVDIGNKAVEASKDELMKQYDNKKLEALDYLQSKAQGAGVKPKRITMKKLKEGGALYKADDMNVRMKQEPMLESYKPYSVQEKGGAKSGGAKSGGAKKGGSRMVKGSPEAKAWAEKMRRARMKK